MAALPALVKASRRVNSTLAVLELAYMTGGLRLRTVIYNQKVNRRNYYPRLSSRAAKFFEERLNSRTAHVALRAEADHSPRTKFRSSTNLLTNQVPNSVLRSQQALLLGGLVILDLGSRENTSIDDRRLRLDFQTPVDEILQSQIGQKWGVGEVLPCSCRRR